MPHPPVTAHARRVLQMRLVVGADDYEDAVRFYRDVVAAPSDIAARPSRPLQDEGQPPGPFPVVGRGVRDTALNARSRRGQRVVRPGILHLHAIGSVVQPGQSTATARAAQISRIRVSPKRPNRLTRIAIETLSTESRFTAERTGTGSSAGSSTTSLTSPLIVVVHGATSARRCRGITTSRDRTTTGRRPISAISHHQTSPRAGTPLTTSPRPAETTPGRPIRLARRVGARHRRRSSRPPPQRGSELAEPRELRPRAQRP